MAEDLSLLMSAAGALSESRAAIDSARRGMLQDLAAFCRDQRRLFTELQAVVQRQIEHQALQLGAAVLDAAAVEGPRPLLHRSISMPYARTLDAGQLLELEAVGTRRSSCPGGLELGSAEEDGGADLLRCLGPSASEEALPVCRPASI